MNIPQIPVVKNAGSNIGARTKDRKQDVIDDYFQSLGIDQEALDAAEKWTKAKQKLKAKDQFVETPVVQVLSATETAPPTWIEPSAENEKRKTTLGVAGSALGLGLASAASLGGATRLGVNAISALSTGNFASAAGRGREHSL